jgi:hypothetical protein
VPVDIDDALKSFLGCGSSPVRMSTAYYVARETIEAWRSGRISTQQALRALADTRDSVRGALRPAAVRQTGAAPADEPAAAERPQTAPSPSDPAGTNDAALAVRNNKKSMSEMRCTCGAIQDHLVPAGVQEVDDREYLELGTCPQCGTTICVRQWRLTSSAHWRASIPPSRDARSSSSIPAAARNPD